MESECGEGFRPSSSGASDALQLAAALVAVEEKTAGFAFVTLDEKLARAAAGEGFSVLGRE